ncbi:hypothetical protein WL482_04275 [Staphylococcus hominis]|uniref:hypothetical protein n=1 Tax=Staphylococcus hominis TaxID=1290 RepID=UPI00287A43B2|nr:hypothetical protein [Staphylococcus hominis]MDS3888917.1 hypothetical protein [Staphylococcus hominis]
MCNISISEWKSLTLTELMKKKNCDAVTIYQCAVDKKLYKYKTIIERKKLSEEEKEFIKKNNFLTVNELSNILHKSHYATLQIVKLLGLYDMIGRRR